MGHRRIIFFPETCFLSPLSLNMLEKVIFEMPLLPLCMAYVHQADMLTCPRPRTVCGKCRRTLGLTAYKHSDGLYTVREGVRPTETRCRDLLAGVRLGDRAGPPCSGTRSHRCRLPCPASGRRPAMPRLTFTLEQEEVGAVAEGRAEVRAVLH